MILSSFIVVVLSRLCVVKIFLDRLVLLILVIMPTVHSVLAQSISANTRRKYIAALEDYATFCDQGGLQMMPLDLEVMNEFFAPLLVSKSFARVSLLVAALKWYCSILGSEVSPQFEKYFKGTHPIFGKLLAYGLIQV